MAYLEFKLREPARKTARSWIMALPMAMVGCPVWKAFITLMRLVGTSFSATRVPIWWRKTLDPSGSKVAVQLGVGLCSKSVTFQTTVTVYVCVVSVAVAPLVLGAPRFSLNLG